MTDPTLIERLDAAIAASKDRNGDMLYFGPADPLLVEVRSHILALEAEMSRRERNEHRNCVNWGPCSFNDGRMAEPGAMVRGSA